jgi:ubiquitin C-terminal hydrolase
MIGIVAICKFDHLTKNLFSRISTLWCLLNCETLISNLKSFQQSRKELGDESYLWEAFLNLYECVVVNRVEEEKVAENLLKIKNIIASVDPSFNGCKMQDACEFFGIFVDKLHQETITRKVTQGQFHKNIYAINELYSSFKEKPRLVFFSILKNKTLRTHNGTNITKTN